MRLCLILRLRSLWKQFVRLCLTLHLRNFLKKSSLKIFKKLLKTGILCSRNVWHNPDTYGHTAVSDSITPLSLFGTSQVKQTTVTLYNGNPVGTICGRLSRKFVSSFIIRNGIVKSENALHQPCPANQLRAIIDGTKRQSLCILCLFPNPEKSGAEKTTGDSQGPSLASLGFHSVHFFDEYQRSQHFKDFY